MTAWTDPAAGDTGASSEAKQPALPDTTGAEPIDPVDAWIGLHSDALLPVGPQPADDVRAPGKLEAARRLVSRRTLEPRVEWAQWYILIGAVLLIACISAGTFGWLLGWTVAAVTMTTWPLVGLKRADRLRLIVAGAALLATLLVAWQFDAHTNLGALALVGSRDTIIGILVLAALLGALTGTRRWLVVQSGIWCLALAGSGWWLAARSRSLSLLSDWQRFLPDKQARQLFSAPVPEPFDFGGVLWLTLASTALFATSAYAGLLISELIKGDRHSLHLSTVNALTLAIWLGGLLTPDGKKLEVGALLLVLAIIAGTRAGGIRELVWLPGALGASVLTREALEVAWKGLLAWWGPVYCDGFLSNECRPSGDLFTLLAGCGLLLGGAAVGYYGRRWVAHRVR